MCLLPDPVTPLFEDLAAECIRRRLEMHGPAPWSICEACLGDGDYQRLSDWAAIVTAPRFNDAGGSAGLVLLAFVSEWNRRNSPGDSVWVGLPPLFVVESTRRKLFTGSNQPTSFVYQTLLRTCERFRLRHAFAAEQHEDLKRYYLSVQLQYGFSLPHAQNQLGNWLRGHQPPEVALRLLEPEGYYRSASFRRLVRDMKSYRRNYLPESDFRRSLRENPWVLPAWENEIVTLIDGIPRNGDEDEPEFRLVSDPRVTWEDGPMVRCRVGDLPDRLTAPRYLLRCAEHDIARYYRDRSGAIKADRREAQIPLDGPEAVITLETPDGEAVEVQSIRLWDPEVVAQVRPIGREAEEAVEHLLPGEQVLITSSEAIVTPTPVVWRCAGPWARRWWLLDDKERVRVEDDGVVWNGEPPPPPPAWANAVFVTLETTGSFFQLHNPVRFRIHAGPGAEVAHASCTGQPLSFANTARTRTFPVPIRTEMSGRCRLRVGVTRGRDSAVIQREVSLPVRAALWADGGGEIPRNEPLSCFEAMNRPVRLLSDGPALIIEGREILGTLPTGRAARIRRILGTGKQLIVANSPFNTIDHFLLAQSAVETGFARSLEREGERFRLSLFRSLPPGERHRLFLWSPTDGTTILGVSEISTEDGGRAWAFRAPWETDTLLAAVAYEGRCLAAAWCGQERGFYDPHATHGADVLTRIALIRWCRLPGLRPDPEAQQQPLIGCLSCFPVEMVRVALLDDGLPADLGLAFEDRESPRGELFNVIFREAYIRPTHGKVEDVFNELPNDFDRLMTCHPVLGCRALQAILSPLVQQSADLTRALLVAMQLRLLSLRGSAGDNDIARREGELRDRARRTFSENGEPMDDSEYRKLVEPIMQHLFAGVSIDKREEDKLRTALGVAPFREYLAARILRRLLDRLS